MSTPTPDEIRAATDALRADAVAWHRAADEVRRAGADGRATVLPREAFTFHAAGTELHLAYEALRVRLGTLLEEGGGQFDAVATALRASADAYDADEAAHAHALRGIY